MWVKSWEQYRDHARGPKHKENTSVGIGELVKTEVKKGLEGISEIAKETDESVKEESVKFDYVSTKENIADILTKGVSFPVFGYLVRKLFPGVD